MSVQYCEQYLLDTLLAVHDFSSDTFMLALYDGNALFNSTTSVYTTDNEIANGNGYTTGGQILTLVSTYPKIEQGQGAVRFVTPVEWTFDNGKLIKWALLYNASKSNKTILSVELSKEVSAIGPFRLNFPLSAAPIINHRAPNIIG